MSYNKLNLVKESQEYKEFLKLCNLGLLIKQKYVKIKTVKNLELKWNQICEREIKMQKM